MGSSLSDLVSVVDVTCSHCRVVQIKVPKALSNRDVMCSACSEAQKDREAAEEEAERQRRAAQQHAAERERRAAAVAELLHQVGANPWEHGHATLLNFDMAEAGAAPVAATRAFLDAVLTAGRYTPVTGLYLFGDTGPGKTHLAVAAARALLLEPRIDPDEIVFDHALTLIGEIQDTYSTGASTKAVIDRRINARVWILDDLGTEAPSDDVARRLTEIFTQRALRPTLVTSNVSPDQLEKRHASLSRVQSRLGPRYFRTVHVKGRDRRFDRPSAEVSR